MKGHKLVSEGPHHYEIKHPDGSTFKVAKAGVSLDMARHLAKLPKVEHDDEGTQPDSATQADDGYTGIDKYIGNAIDAVKPYLDLNAPPVDPSGHAPSEPTPGTVAPPTGDATGDIMNPQGQLAAAANPDRPAQANPNTVSPVQPGSGQSVGPQQAGMMPGYDKALGLEASGINTQAAGQMQYAKDAEAIQRDALVKQQQAAATYQTELAQNNAENKQLSQDYANSKIDPGRVWSNASTGSKIAAGIGVLLSGIGSGLTGQQNMAMTLINKTIDRDMEAQRADLGKKENLLSQNLRKYGDIKSAYAATQAQLIAATQGQLAASAAKLGGTQAQAAMQMGMGQLEEKRVGLQAMAAQRGLAASAGSGAFAGQPVNPEYLPPDMQKRAIPTPSGGFVLARAGSEAKDVRQSLTSLQNIESRVDDALKFQTNVGRTVPGSSNSAVGDSTRNGIIASMGELNDLKRLNEQEFGMWKDMVPDPGAWRQDKATAQLMQLKRLVAEKRNSIFANETEGYNPGRSSSRDVPLTGGK